MNNGSWEGKQYSVFPYENEGKRAAARLSLTGLECVQVVDQVKFMAPHFYLFFVCFCFMIFSEWKAAKRLYFNPIVSHYLGGWGWHELYLIPGSPSYGNLSYKGMYGEFSFVPKMHRNAIK